MSRHVKFETADEKYITPINGRLPIVVADGDGDAYIHFLALAPEGVSLEDARAMIEVALSEAQAAGETDGDVSPDWDYGDVKERLKAKGFLTFYVDVFEGD